MWMYIYGPIITWYIFNTDYVQVHWIYPHLKVRYIKLFFLLAHLTKYWPQCLSGEQFRAIMALLFLFWCYLFSRLNTVYPCSGIYVSPLKIVISVLQDPIVLQGPFLWKITSVWIAVLLCFIKWHHRIRHDFFCVRKWLCITVSQSFSQPEYDCKYWKNQYCMIHLWIEL